MGYVYFGLRACNMSLSTLHAEMEGLLWTGSCMKDMRITSIRFETDCSDLVDMTTNPEDWPTFATGIEVVQRLHEGFRGCEPISYSSEYEWSGGCISKRNKNQRLYFLSYRSDPTRRRCSSENQLV